MQDRTNEFVRQRIFEAVVGLCRNIKISNGYNTQPFVTTDPREVSGKEEAFILLILPGNETVEEVGVGGCHDMILEVNVYGYAQTDDGTPVHELNKLMQDVRSVIHQNTATVAEYADRGLAFRLGDLETDEGALAHGGVAAFVQSLNYGYKNYSNW